MAFDCLSHVPILPHDFTWLDSVYYEKKDSEAAVSKVLARKHEAGPLPRCKTDRRRNARFQ
jgi:hypothetical protein